MELKVNNVSVMVPEDYTVSRLLDHMKYHGSSAVFVNGRQILFCEYKLYRLKEKDTVKIVRILGGG
jgi:thiamine biosynthesis protein ThiS